MDARRAVFTGCILAVASMCSAAAPSAAALAGSWRVLSSRVFYDAGGGGAMNRGVGHTLEFTKDGHQAYSSSSGSFKVERIEKADWKTWNATNYGPTSKIVLTGWKEGKASGPIETSEAGVDFVWIIYRVGPPLVQSPGVVHVKFGLQRP